jgi:Carboxypeptidase regulatory-like domain
MAVFVRLSVLFLSTLLTIATVATSAGQADQPLVPDPVTLSNSGDTSNLKPARPLNSTAGSTFISQSVVPKEESEKKKEAQPSSSIAGKITNESKDRPIAEARVVLAKVDEEHKRFQIETGADGTYKFEDVEPGKYTLTVSAKDMLAGSQIIELANGEVRTLDVPLADLEPVDILRVTGKRTLIHPEEIGSQTDLDHKFVYQYKDGNDLRALINSTPGVMNDSYGNMITRGEHNAVNYVVDDVVIPEAAGVLQQTQVISPRSIQSMSVDIGGYEASDGGGPLGAVAHVKSLPISSKPNFNIGQQIGGPLAGSIFYNASGAFSQNNDFWNKFRFESSGSFRGTTYGIAPPVKDYVNNNRIDINSFTKLEFLATPRDTFRLTTSINQTSFQIPTSGISSAAGVRDHQSDGQNYIIASYIHKFEKWLDEANLHILNGIYYERFRSSGAFDPGVQFNNGQPEVSISANAKRFNYVFSAQGNVLKTYKKTHHFKAGFLTELRPVSTSYSATYFNANYLGSIPSASNPSPVPFGAVISPFTGLPGGPSFNGNMGKFSGFRYLQSAFFQDKYTPQNGFWKRLTLDGGVRFDMQRSIYGNSLALAQAIESVPGAGPFALGPYQKQATTDAQVSGRYGAALVVAKNTVLRGSFSNLFMPNPNDYFITPYLVGPAGTQTAGVYDGTPRPLHATRGYLMDTSLEKQLGSRVNTRTNLFYKYLTNFGDSGVVGNLPLYNRLTNSAQDAYGVETRIDLKPKRDGYGFNGFLSNTIQVAYLRGTKTPSGGFYDTPTAPFMKFPDHDRRFSGTAGLGYKTHQNVWSLLSIQVLSGLQDERDPAIYGPHPQRTPVVTDLSFSAGYQTPRAIIKEHRWFPTSFDVRISNLLNQRVPVNLGSPFQGTRFNLPIRVLASCQWQLGKEEAKLSGAPKPSI